MSVFWFERTRDIITNHFVTMDPEAYPRECVPYREQLRGRSMLVRKAEPLPVECVVRGYLSGSGWTDYCRERSVSGIALPEGLRESERLPEPLFTPSTKAPAGEHDVTITRKAMESIIGTDLTSKVIEVSLKIYERASAIAESAGIIIADTKMEFGLAGGELTLIDELLTPDSSRFWPKADYRAGGTQRSYDKQFLRDYLTSIHWDKRPPAPPIPPDIVEKTRDKYLEALRCLVR
jgi:phosphoribosylaminoimidazole-succinocarboxamide synthase